MMGKVITHDFGYEGRVNLRNEHIAICPGCDSEQWLLILNHSDPYDQKITAYECEGCGWRVDIAPIGIHREGGGHDDHT